MEIKDNIIKVEKIDWIEIQPIQSSKFKEITDLDSLKASIKNEGFSVPFIVWENNGTIYSIDGFHRKLALEQFEQEGIEVPEKLDAVFISANNMKDAAIKLIALQPKAAKITQQGFEEFKTSFEIIDSEVEEYNIEAINMDSEVVNEILEASEDDFDEELPINPITVLGDLYEIGEHRLLCGDSTQTDTFEKLMQGELADMVVTDPPYNVAYEGKTKDALTIENDSMANDDFYKFLYDFYSALTTAVKKGGRFMFGTHHRKL